MITHAETSADTTRHRLLEGYLRRLARLPQVEHFILRGGMLMRMWFYPLPRSAADLDFVCTLPFDVDEVGRHLVSALSMRETSDDVAYDTERIRVHGIWLNTDFPGVRMHAIGKAEGETATFHVDLAFNEPLVPQPELGPYRISNTESIDLRMCRPETIVARKLHSLWYNGMRGWRPKDLYDVRMILRVVATDRRDLAEAITASFASRGDTSREVRMLFAADHAWWATKTAAARWYDFAAGMDAVARLSLPEVIADVTSRLKPALDQLP